MKEKAKAVLENSNDEVEENENSEEELENEVTHNGWHGGKKLTHDALLKGKKKFVLDEAGCKDGSASEKEVPLNSDDEGFVCTDHQSASGSSSSSGDSSDSTAESKEMRGKDDDLREDGEEEDSSDSTAESKEMRGKDDDLREDGEEEGICVDEGGYSDDDNNGHGEHNEESEQAIKNGMPDDLGYSEDEDGLGAIQRQGINPAVGDEQQEEMDPEHAFDLGFKSP